MEPEDLRSATTAVEAPRGYDRATRDSHPDPTTTPDKAARDRAADRRRWRMPRGFGGVSTPLALGLAVRLALAPYLSWPGDDEAWAHTASTGVHHLSLYQQLGFPYPPAFGHVLQFLGGVLQHLGLSSAHFAVFVPGMTPNYAIYVTSPWFNIAFKSILFAFDVGTAFLLLGLVMHLTGDTVKARRAFWWFFLNPLVIVESAVMGAFDVMAAFFILAAVYCAITGRNRWLGATLVIGILVKLAPAFVAPMLVVAAISLGTRGGSGGRRDRGLRVLGDLALGGAAAAACLLIPEVIGGDIGLMFHATFSREVVGAQFGGFSVFGLSVFRGLGWIGTATTNNITVVRAVVFTVEAAAVTWSTVRSARDPSPRTLLGTATVLLAAVCLLGPLTQPQYLVWLLPLVVAVTVSYGGRRWPAVVISTAPLLFIVYLLGPYALVAPLASFTGLISPSAVSSHVSAWMRGSPGLWAYQASGYGGGPSTLAVIVALVALAIRWSRSPRGEQQVAQAAGLRASMPAMTAVAAMSVALVVPSVIMATTTWSQQPPRASLSSWRKSSSGVDLHLSVQPGSGQQQVRFVAFPVRPTPPIRSIDVYYDPRFPYAGTDQRAQLGIVDHVRAELAIRGWRVPFRKVDSHQLASVLSDVSGAPGTVVVDMSGVFPASVFSSSTNLVSPWLVAGGTMVWGGSPIGTYSAPPDPSASLVSSYSRGLGGPNTILGRGVAPGPQKPSRTASSPTAIARALGITVQGTSVGVRTAAVVMRGGRPLGWTGHGYSSVSALPVGAGTVVMFAGSVYDAQDTSSDVVSLLLSHGFALQGGVASMQLTSAQVQARDGQIDWRVETAALGMHLGDQLRVVEIDPDRRGAMLQSQTVAVRPKS